MSVRPSGRTRSLRALAAASVAVLASSAFAQTVGGPVAFDPARLKDPVDIAASANLICGPCGTTWLAFDTQGSTAAFTGSCSATGISIIDASGFSSGDAYDVAWNMWVNGVQYAGTGTPSGTCGYGGPVNSMGGVNVTLNYKASSTDSILRILGTFQNPTGSPVTVTVQMPVNFGSDSSTIIQSTSSGDTSVTTADRWAVSSDSFGPGDPVNTTVWQGPGTVSSPVTTVVTTVFDCAATPGIGTQFSLTVPPSSTRRLMWFGAMGNHGVGGTCLNTVAAANAAATRFNTLAGLPADLISDLGDTTNIANWSFAPIDAPALDGVGLLALVLALLAGGIGFLLVRRS